MQEKAAMVHKLFLKNGLSIAIHAAILASVAVLPSVAFAENAVQSAPQSTAVDSQQNENDQEASAKKPITLQSVQVTGSHIRQVDLATQEPISTITHEDIVKTGLVTLGQVLNQMTTVGVSGMGTQSVQSPDSINQGGAFVNFRYLGSQRVLVLVNGKRWVTNPDGSVDLTSIPTSAVERIEILKDGASAVYGSDAISGVINIITRTNFEGMQLNVGYGVTDKGDWEQPKIDLMLGTANDKSSILMDLSYSKVGAMWQRSRDLTKYGPGGPYHPTSAFYQVSPRGMFTDSTGSYMLNNLGDDTMNLANYTKVDPQHLPVEDTFNQYQVAQFRIPVDQTSLYANGHYDFNDKIRFTMSGMYTERRTSSIIGPYPLSKGIFQGLGGLISKDSIYNPTDEDISFNVIYPDLNRWTVHLVRSMHVDTGLEGDFTVGDSRNWHWDAFINFNKQSGTNTLHNNINLAYVQRAIGPSFINADGVPTCGTPDDPIDNYLQEPCTPLNVLAGPDGLTPEIMSHMVVNPNYTFQFADKGGGADITGGLFDIPFGGEVAFAAGVSVRKETGFSRAEIFKQLGLTTTATAATTDGGFSERDAYLEFDIPLLKDLPWAKLLDIDIATRYSHYSNFGSTTNSKIGFQYKPIDDLLIRGTYAEAFRAPTINDVAGGAVNGYSGYTDPCDAQFGVAVYGEAVHAACLNDLRSIGYPDPENFRELSHVGSPITRPNQEGGELFTSGPQPDLGPETAKTLTAGFVYNPHQIDGLSLEVNWWRIDLRNVISSVGANDVLQNCYLGVQSSCAAFHRDPVSGQVKDLYYGLANIGYEKLEGEDVGFRYRLPMLPIGQLAVGSDISYYAKFESQAKAGAPVQQQIGWGSIWRIRGDAFVRWSMGDWSATWRTRYFSSLRELCAYGTVSECNMPDHIDPYRGASPANRIGAIAFNDVSVSWKGGNWGNVTAGINNVLDRQPPITYSVPSGDAPIQPAYDLGRYFFVHYQKTF